jgi:hypothetical protein
MTQVQFSYLLLSHFSILTPRQQLRQQQQHNSAARIDSVGGSWRLQNVERAARAAAMAVTWAEGSKSGGNSNNLDTSSDSIDTVSDGRDTANDSNINNALSHH